MQKHSGTAKTIPILILLLLLNLSCNRTISLIPEAPQQEQEELNRLLIMIDQQPESAEGNADQCFVLWEQIIQILARYNHQKELISLLGNYIMEHPEDPFNSYYLYVRAQEHKKQNLPEPAIMDYERLLNNHPDLRINNESIHFLALKNLILLLEDNPYKRLTYYQLLEERFLGKIDQGELHFYLAETYEDMGEWEKAITHYREYLKYPDSVIPERPGIRKTIINKVGFYDSDKSWTREDINALIASIQYATRTMNVWALRSYQSRVGFFMLPWDHTEEESLAAGGRTLDIRTFLRLPITFAREFDPDSNDKEVYLRSTGWKYSRTWYFYFRKVDFPADPEINGQWEWAGIFYGEKI